MNTEVYEMPFVDAECSNQTKATIKMTCSDMEVPQQSSSSVFIDKLSVTLTINADELNEITERVYKAIADKSIFQSAKWSQRFKICRHIALPGTSERVLFQFGAKGPGPDCRIEFNPSKLGFDGVGTLDMLLLLIFPSGWFYVVQHGRVSRIDVAVDLVGRRVDDFLAIPHQGLVYREFRSNGELKTLYLGSPGSNQTRIYSKSAQQKSKGVPTYQSIVRVERTLRNLNMKLKDLDQLENPFSHLVFTFPVPPPLPGIAEWRWSMFLDSVQVRGLAPALALQPEKTRARFRKHLKANPVPWWDPAAIWQTWLSALEVIG